MIQQERIQTLKELPLRAGRYVLYWMQASQRAAYNHALEYAIECANLLGQPLVVFFGITRHYLEATERHYRFMLEGLAETQAELGSRGIPLIVQVVEPVRGARELSKKASLVVTDRGYLRMQREWRESLAGAIDCPLIQVESDAIVPVEVASTKLEYSAATIRRKIGRLLEGYFLPLRKRRLKVTSGGGRGLASVDLHDIDSLLRRLKLRPDPHLKRAPRGGRKQGLALLRAFVKRKLPTYHLTRNNPRGDGTSQLSPYLHFGQLSPLEVALAVAKVGGEGAGAYLDELIVRRELALNFVTYNEAYDAFSGLPAWAQRTLNEHKRDRRAYLYDRETFEQARTHDELWNGAQRDLLETGRIHGYLRMYWGKKILEWSRTPEEAFETAIFLNDRYEFDGRDPNGYAGVAWCFGTHDRPWPRREIFGNVRYMSEAGVRRKMRGGIPDEGDGALRAWGQDR